MSDHHHIEESTTENINNNQHEEQPEEVVDWNNNGEEKQQQDPIAEQFSQLQQAANQAANPSKDHSRHHTPKERQQMNIPVASLGGNNNNINNNSRPSSTANAISNTLLDSARKVTTRERQREREYKKTLVQQERGNADVDYSNWESGNAPDAMSLRIARAVTDLVRDAFANVTAIRREIRQRNCDATANGSPLSDEAAGAVSGSMHALYPLTGGLVEALEEGLRAVMPLFSSSMRNTEGLSTLVQIRDQLKLETTREIDDESVVKPTTVFNNNNIKSKGTTGMIPLPPPPPPPSQQQQQNSSRNYQKSSTTISRLDAHPLYDREEENENHMQKALATTTTNSASSARNANNKNNSTTSMAFEPNQGGSAMSNVAGGPKPILTTLAQVQHRIQEQSESWPSDHRRHQAHSTLHQRVHPTKADATKRVQDAKAKMLKDNNVESIVPPPLNKLLLASLPQSARQVSTSSTNHHHHNGSESSARTTTTIAELKRLGKEKVKFEAAMNQEQQQQVAGADNISPSTKLRRSKQLKDHDDLMARYPTNTVDGFSARILSLHDAKLASGLWRQLSVTEKQHIIAFEQRENRYHHAHGVTNMKLAGLRMKLRRSQKSGIELSAADYAALAEGERRKRILEEQRACDVRQTAMLVRNWLPPLPEKFQEE